MLEQKQSVCDRQKAWVVIIALPTAIIYKEETQQSIFIHKLRLMFGEFMKSCERVP